MGVIETQMHVAPAEQLPASLARVMAILPKDFRGNHGVIFTNKRKYFRQIKWWGISRQLREKIASSLRRDGLVPFVTRQEDDYGHFLPNSVSIRVPLDFDYKDLIKVPMVKKFKCCPTCGAKMKGARYG